MKKLGFVVVFVLVLLLSACGSTNNLNSIKTELEAIGYVFEQRDDDARSYYNEKAVNDAYSIDVTLTDLYIGYVDGDQGWLELLQFESESDCNAFIEGTTESGYIIYHEGDTAFITYNSDAMSPFIDSSTKGE